MNTMDTFKWIVNIDPLEKQSFGVFQATNFSISWQPRENTSFASTWWISRVPNDMRSIQPFPSDRQPVDTSYQSEDTLVTQVNYINQCNIISLSSKSEIFQGSVRDRCVPSFSSQLQNQGYAQSCMTLNFSFYIRAIEKISMYISDMWKSRITILT